MNENSDPYCIHEEKPGRQMLKVVSQKKWIEYGISKEEDVKFVIDSETKNYFQSLKAFR
jgi:hypothetical protein